MMKRKIFFGLGLLLAGAMMVGCGKKGNEQVDQKKGIIRIAIKDENSSNPNTVKYFDELNKIIKEEGIDAEMQIVDLPSEGYEEKLNLQISSGDIPDIIYFQGGDETISNQELLEDLRPYVKDSKYIKNLIGEHNTKRLENYPYLMNVNALTASTPVVKKEIFEKTKMGATVLENPTVENYEAFLKELIGIKDGEGNEIKYGITTSGDIRELDNIFNMAFGNTQTWLKTSDGYVYSKISDQQKEKIKFYRSLYENQLLDQQFLTKKWDTKENAFYDGEAGVISGTSGKVIDMYNDKVKQLNNTELVVLPPAKGEAQGFGAVDISKEKRGYAISSQSKNKDVAFEILDFIASPKGQLLDRLGFEGTQYNVEDGKIKVTEESSQWYPKFWEPIKVDVGIELATPLMSDVAMESLESVSSFYQEDNNFIIPEELIAKWDATENLYNEYVADIITGKKEISEFDKFVEEWKNSGGNELTDYANEHIK